MKFILSFIFCSVLSTQVWALDLPKGDFEFTNTQAVSTKHIHSLYHNSKKEQILIADYRANNYICARKNKHITECSKNIEINPNKIEFKTEKLSKLSPTFADHVESINEVSSADAVSIYEIKQDNSTNERQNKMYKVYDITDSGFYIDLKKSNSNSVRFEMVNPRVLTHFSFQTEKLSKREFFKHGFTSYYIK